VVLVTRVLLDRLLLGSETKFRRGSIELFTTLVGFRGFRKCLLSISSGLNQIIDPSSSPLVIMLARPSVNLSDS
ncbi:hypothetical protein LINPERPRIM_LOCUS27996, partial [Linum perenne]